MQTRTYALALSALVCGLFVAVVATNLIIDPQRVFGTGFLPTLSNENDRYQQLIAYQAAPQQYDGLVFGSSRANAIRLDELSRSMGGVRFASFVVVGGMMVDHLAALEYVLRDKTARHERLRAVFLLLDVDIMGRRPFTNQSNQFLMPPALSGENPARFWWKNLVAIQFKAWRSALRATRRSATEAQGVSIISRILRSVAAARVVSPANAQPRPGASPLAAPEHERITRRPGYRGQLELLERFVALCREHDVQIQVAISPLSIQASAPYDPVDLGAATDDIVRIIPVWDFTSSELVSNNPAMWLDPVHFQPLVGQMMLRRMFGGEVPPAWASFGRRLPP